MIGGIDRTLHFGRRTLSRRSKEEGYTLMELLVVLAILGLLAAIATPMVLHYLDSAKVSTAKTEVSNLAAGLDLFKYDVGRYPTTEEGLQALISSHGEFDLFSYGAHADTAKNDEKPPIANW
jgi:prepilin-type N-terminal cleavage/methylation domain-containing protein